MIYAKIYTAFAILAFFPTWALGQAINRANIDDSTCVVVVQGSENVTVGDVCSKADARKVNVRFVWLDQDQYAFLRVGYVQPKARFLFGESPNIFQNQVHRELENIYQQFGSRVSSRLVEQFRNPNAVAIIEKGKFPTFTDGGWDDDIPTLSGRQLRNLRVLNAHGPIIWPDKTYLSSLNQGRLYTKGYEYRLNYYPEYYRNLDYVEDLHFLGNRRQFLRSIQQDLEDGGADPVLAYCLLATRWASRAEFLEYWTTVDRMFEAYTRPFENFPRPENQFAFDRNDAAEFNELATVLGRYEKNGFEFDGFEELYSDVYSNPSYDLIEYVTSENWPEDFLVLEGAFRDAVDARGECGGSLYTGRANLHAIPRNLSVLVAVFEAATDDPVTVSGLTARVDDQRSLRANAIEGPEFTFSVGEEVLTKANGERLVIPLQMEFVYDHEEAFVLGQNIADGVRLSGLTSEQKSIDLVHCDDRWFCGVFASMDASKVSTDTSPIASSSYVFGPAIKLTSFQINGGDEFQIREVPEVATYSKYSYGYGSCPYLYFIHSDGSETLHGRVLVGASNAEKAFTESVQLPDDVVEIVIKELEPEVSYLTRIGMHRADGVVEEGLEQPIVLKPQQGVRLSVPSGTTSLSISGYYETL